MDVVRCPPSASERLDRIFPNVISETEARDRWCPWARVAAPDEGPTFNRLDAGREQGQPVAAVLAPRVARCLTRQCMAWRNAGTAGHGYCGAAGAP
jgi:hypothetical protein